MNVVDEVTNQLVTTQAVASAGANAKAFVRFLVTKL
jgi:hypothetical protein